MVFLRAVLGSVWTCRGQFAGQLRLIVATHEVIELAG